MIRKRSRKIQAVILTFILLVSLLPVSPLFAAGEKVIYENNFESDSTAVDVGGNKALEFTVTADPANSWLGIFQKDLYFEYTDKINAGATMTFDLILPVNATYTGVFKAQAVTKMGSSWSWTQASAIPELDAGKFADQGNGTKKASVSISFGTEIEAVQGLKAIVPCLAASNCNYNGKIYLDNVKLVDGSAAPPQPILTTIYENNFESDSSAVDIGGNKALEFTVAGDPGNSWLGIFQKELVFAYTEKINAGATMTFDLYLPDAAAYAGVFKAQAVTKMGDSWAWTQASAIPDIGIDKFADQGNGYKKASVSIAFGTEIEAVQGLKAIIPCLAASNCDYNGKIYLDNVKLMNAEAGGGEPELPKVDPITLPFDSADSIAAWSDGGNYDYSGGITIGYDADLGAMKLGVDYSASSSSTWSEAKVKYTFAAPQQLLGYNRFSFDFIYDPAKMTKGSFMAKLSAGIISANASVSGETNIGNGLKKVTVVISLAGADNTINDFILGLVGSGTDYKGSIYIDNVTFSQVVEPNAYVTATISPEAQTPVQVNSDSIAANGQTQTTLSNIKLADDNAKDYTVKLAAYLEAIGRTDSVLFGHQNDITHKSGNPALTNSDTKDITGSIAAVMGIDALSLTGNELPAAAWNLPLAERVAAVEAVTKEAAGQGAIVTLSAHMPNFEIIDQRVKRSQAGTADPSDSNSAGILSDGHYNFSGYTPGTLTGDIVKRIMPGQDLNYLLTDYLDMIAVYGKALEADNISVLFRPFHENTGSWFWWGRAFCDQEAFKNLYKYTVEYLRDVKGVHNFIYVYGPSSDAESMADYALRYPGDDYVDMVGFDMYHQSPAVGDNFIDQFKTELAIVQQFATEHNKLFAVTETGVSNGNQAFLKTGNARKDWFNEILDAVAPTNASYFLVWANFGENTSFYTPYVVSKTASAMKGQEMLDNFIDYYNDPRSVFASQMGDFTKLSATAAKNTNVTGYITAPVSGSRILDTVTFEASVRNGSDSSAVKFVARNKAGDISLEIAAAKNTSGRYVGTLTAGQLALLGRTAGTLSLVVDGTTFNSINLKYNMPAPVVDPTVVDTFEDYDGDSAILNTTWSTGKGTGCTITPALSGQCYAGDYGLEFRYSMIAGGYAGVTKSMNGADWSGKNALQLWTIPDGKKQKVVVQVTSGANVFEVYLNEYAAYNAAKNPLLVTIPFSSFVGRDNKAAVFDASSIQSFGLWCNTIVPAGEDQATYKLDSALYYDDIKTIPSDATAVTFKELIPNRSPVLDVIGNKSVNEGELLEFTVTASDPDSDILAFSAANLPTGAAFDISKGAFAWTPNYKQSGKYTVTFAVTDGRLSDSKTIEITVNNVTAVQYTNAMIDTIQAMGLDKVTNKLLISELENVSKHLDANKPIPALAGIKSFMQKVKQARKITMSSENTEILLEDAAQLSQIIINDYPLIKTKEKAKDMHDICKESRDKKGKITDSIFDNLCNRFDKIIDSVN